MATVMPAARTGLWSSTVGRKIVMSVAGLVLYGFVIAHMLGNLKVYLGPEEFNHYAEGLRTFGAPFFPRGYALWLARLILLAAVLVHIVAGVQLSMKSRAARKVSYKKFEGLEFSWASRTMFWGGITIFAFIIFHLLDLTFGVVNPQFIRGDAYHNFVTTFQRVPVSIAYIAAMIPLGLHLYHGFWSMMQTLGFNNPRYNHIRRPIAATLAALIALANMSFPIAVLMGVVK